MASIVDPPNPNAGNNDPKALLEDLSNFASCAVKFDESGEFEAAAYFYEEAVKVASALPASTASGLNSKIKEYSERAKFLRNEVIKQKAPPPPEQIDRCSDLERAKFLLIEALAVDEAGNIQEAVEQYGQAVELCLKAKEETKDEETKKKLIQVATQALERAEELKGISRSSQRKESSHSQTKKKQDDSGSRIVPPLGFDFLSLKDETKAQKDVSKSPNTSIKTIASSSGGGNLTDEEKKVLAITSMINGRSYVPFLSVDLQEKFAYQVPFADKHGKLALAPKQQKKLISWARPEEFIPNPTVVNNVDCFSVKQTVISDCSFVASIAISAQYEKRFGKRLITSIIYPQNRKGEPVYNPCGKYMIKLRINGVPRKIIIDDYFPLGPGREPLCSYSSNRNELWISLLEKAYMKVMGGYDFPGSNSNIDLHALTGWIPERISIRSNDKTFDKEKIFKKLYQRFHNGDVLVTLATGDMSEAEADRAGLVPTHAYAMLNIREVDGVKLVMLKNPWSHLRWRGNYSELDNTHWTPKLQKELGYNPKSAQNFDNGVFWIDYDSVCRFFDVIYMNWNPALFKYTYAIHQSWSAGVGPSKDLYNISNNPQFSLELAPGNGALWILLSRHITDIEDFKNNREYITVLIYRNDGKRVFYPFDPPPFIDGVRINSPHYLCQTVIKDDTPRRLTLVVSQFEKTSTIYFTLRVYSSLSFSLKKITDPYKYEQKARGEWKGESAGGCGNYRDTYQNNPRFQFSVEVESKVLIEMAGPKEYQIGFDVKCVLAGNRESPLYFKNKQSGPYRSGFVVLALDLTSGTYDIIPTTFRPGQEGPFLLKVRSTSCIKLARIQ